MTEEEIIEIAKESYIAGAKNVVNAMKDMLDTLILSLEKNIKEEFNQHKFIRKEGKQ